MLLFLRFLFCFFHSFYYQTIQIYIYVGKKISTEIISIWNSTIWTILFDGDDILQRRKRGLWRWKHVKFMCLWCALLKKFSGLKFIWKFGILRFEKVWKVFHKEIRFERHRSNFWRKKEQFSLWKTQIWFSTLHYLFKVQNFPIPENLLFQN